MTQTCPHTTAFSLQCNEGRGGKERVGEERGGSGRKGEEMRGQWRGVGGEGGEGRKDEHETVTTCMHPVVIAVLTHNVVCYSTVYRQLELSVEYGRWEVGVNSEG